MIKSLAVLFALTAGALTLPAHTATADLNNDAVVIVGDVVSLPDPAAENWHECQYIGEDRTQDLAAKPVLHKEMKATAIRFFSKSGLCSGAPTTGEQYIVWYLGHGNVIRYTEWFNMATEPATVRGYDRTIDSRGGETDNLDKIGNLVVAPKERASR